MIARLARGTIPARFRDDDRGSVLIQAILFPVTLLLILLVVQVALIGHGNNLLSAAADLGVERTRSAGGGNASTAATEFLQAASAGRIVKHVRVQEQGVNRKQVTVRGQVISIVPGVPEFPIVRIARGPRERTTG